jgi:hypothetical protein
VIGKPPLNVALVEVGEGHREVLRKACLAAGYSPVFKTLNDASTHRLGRWADIVVVESDLGFRALHSAEKARRAGMPPVGVLVNWWSDLEQDAREAADFVLHVPLAAEEIGDVLAAAIPLEVKDTPPATVPDVVVSAEQAIAGPAVPLPVLGFR